MKDRFYKILIFINNDLTRSKKAIGERPLSSDYDESILYAMARCKLRCMYWNKENKETEFSIDEMNFVSPLKPQEIMNLPLIEYDGDKKQANE